MKDKMMKLLEETECLCDFETGQDLEKDHFEKDYHTLIIKEKWINLR